MAFKIIFVLLFSMSLNASMLLDKNTPICIEDYYVQNGTFYYKDSSSLNWFSVANEYHLSTFINEGFIYDSQNDICYPDNSTILGLKQFDYNLLLAFTGVLFGFVILVFSIFSVINLGGRK
jgi:hypothetical protein